MTRRTLIPVAAFMLGAALIAGVYLGLLGWAQGWAYASAQLARDRWYVVPIVLGFGIQSGLYSILRFRLFVPAASAGRAGALIGTSGATSTTAMVACCIHHVTEIFPVLGLSAAAAFLARYQRPFMLAGLGMNLIGIAVMLAVILRHRRKLQAVPETQ